MSGQWPPAIWNDDRRMGAMMAELVLSDEEDVAHKLAFWHDTFIAYQQHIHASPPASQPSSLSSNNAASSFASSSSNISTHHHPPLSFSLEEVQKGMSRRGTIPPALEPTLLQMLEKGEIRRVDSYFNAGSSSNTSLKSKVAGYVWSWLSPSKPVTRLGAQTRYVLVSQVERATEQFQSQLAALDEELFTLQQLQQIAGRSTEDVLLLVQQLSKGQHPLTEAFPAAAETSSSSSSSTTSVASAPPSQRVFKKGNSATSTDHARCLLARSIATIQNRITEKERYISDRDKEARRMLIEKRKPAALLQLQMKKRCIKQLDTLHQQFENLDSISSHLEQSLSHHEYLACLKQASVALKHATPIDIDELNDVNDELAQQLSQVQITGQAMAQPLVDNVDIESEYAELMREVGLEEEGQKQSAAGSSASGGSSEKQTDTTHEKPPPYSSVAKQQKEEQKEKPVLAPVLRHGSSNNKASNSGFAPRQLNYAKTNPYSFDSYDYLCKLLVIGDSGCGKSSLLKRFSDDEFNIGYSSTIGVDFEVRTVDVANKKVKMQMWDTAGQERFRTITSSYYRGAHAVLVVFDVTQEDSFRNVHKWLQELETVHAGAAHNGHVSSPQILLVANKTDLVKQRVVETHRIEQMAQELSIPYLETSAKLNQNVTEAFQTLASNFLRARMIEESEGRWSVGGPGGKKEFQGNGMNIREDGSSSTSSWKKCFGCTIM